MAPFDFSSSSPDMILIDAWIALNTARSEQNCSVESNNHVLSEISGFLYEVTRVTIAV